MPKNLEVDTFPDPIRHFGAPWRPFWILQAVRRCRRWASAPGAARLLFCWRLKTIGRGHIFDRSETRKLSNTTDRQRTCILTWNICKQCQNKGLVKTNNYSTYISRATGKTTTGNCIGYWKGEGGSRWWKQNNDDFLFNLNRHLDSPGNFFYCLHNEINSKDKLTNCLPRLGKNMKWSGIKTLLFKRPKAERT